jgi:uncharacterized membrane protein YdjX (TVP38/TMEM64 family)
VSEYLILFAIVLGVNMMPAFGPPTWSIIVLFGLQTDHPIAPVVLVAALAAALGRYLLALAFRFLGGRLSAETRDNLAAAREALERNRRTMMLALGLFVLSPVPSAQLFEAAGLAKIRLLPFTAAFFAGRTVSYSIYAYTAQSIRQTNLGDAFLQNITTPWGIAVQLAMLALLVLFARIDWRKYLER